MVITHLKKGEHDLLPSRTSRRAVDRCRGCTSRCSTPTTDGSRPGESGEVCTHGPLVMNGYKGLVDETAAALSGDWLHTGDVGRFDDDGYLYIVDRTKDMVITGGFNVFPREVEDVLTTHPAVGMVMVIGVPDDKWGEAVKAVVVLQPGREPSDELTRELQQLVKDAKGRSSRRSRSTTSTRSRSLPSASPTRRRCGPLLDQHRACGLVAPRPPALPSRVNTGRQESSSTSPVGGLGGGRPPMRRPTGFAGRRQELGAASRSSIARPLQRASAASDAEAVETSGRPPIASHRRPRTIVSGMTLPSSSWL